MPSAIRSEDAQVPPWLRIMGTRRDVRRRVIAGTAAAIVALGALIGFFPDLQRVAARMLEDPRASHAKQARKREIDQRFEQAVIMLHAKRYDYAVAALHRLLELAPDMPEAHVNMGYALLGAGNPGAARDFFESATELRPQQANAYYGLAVALEGIGDLPAAIGAMRTFVHLSPDGDPYMRKANSALWEWEEKRRASAAREPAGPGKK